MGERQEWDLARMGCIVMEFIGKQAVDGLSRLRGHVAMRDCRGVVEHIVKAYCQGILSAYCQGILSMLLRHIIIGRVSKLASQEMVALQERRASQEP
jgi:hypothetical protein